MYIYRLQKSPKLPLIYDPKSGLTMPVGDDGNIVNDISKDSVQRFLKIKKDFYFPELNIFKSIKKLQLPSVDLNEFKAILNKLAPFDPKYKSLFLEILRKYMLIISVDEYRRTYTKAYQNITGVVFASKPNLLCISFVSHKKQVRASKFNDTIQYVNAPIVDGNIKAGFMTIDFQRITSIAKVNALAKELLVFLSGSPLIKDQIQLYSKKITNKSEKKVRFSSRVYFNDEIPRPRIKNRKGILKV